MDGYSLGTINRLNVEISNYQAALNQANANVIMLNKRVERLVANLATKEAEAAVQAERIRELELALASKTAHDEGLVAQLAMFKAAHPSSPALADSGKRYKDGNVKSVGRIAYEAAFDKYGADRKIANFKQYRAD